MTSNVRRRNRAHPHLDGAPAHASADRLWAVGDNGVMDLGMPEQIPSAEVLRTRYLNRLPARLEDLAGPAEGTVDLSLHVVWSGLRSFPLDCPKLSPHAGRDVCHGKRGTIHQAYRDGMEDQLGALGLVLSDIVLWTTKYFDAAACTSAELRNDKLADVQRRSRLRLRRPRCPCRRCNDPRRGGRGRRTVRG